jgi:hypothetical protein
MSYTIYAELGAQLVAVTLARGCHVIHSLHQSACYAHVAMFEKRMADEQLRWRWSALDSVAAAGRSSGMMQLLVKADILSPKRERGLRSQEDDLELRCSQRNGPQEQTLPLRCIKGRPIRLPQVCGRP